MIAMSCSHPQTNLSGNLISKSRAFHSVGAAYINDRSKNELTHISLIGGTHNKQTVRCFLTCVLPGFVSVVIFQSCCLKGYKEYCYKNLNGEGLQVGMCERGRG